VNHGFLLVTRVGEFVEDERELARLWMPFLVGRAASNWETMRQARRNGAPIPPIYSLPIVWYTDPPGPQYLFSVLEVLSQGWGDCKALICIRMAELAEQGHKSTPRIVWRSPRELPPGSGAQMHAQLRHEPRCTCRICKHQPEAVQRAGFIEEPSRMLGM
jgi:hypothetical protein